MASVWRAYLRVLEKYPLRTQMIQTGFLMGSGDVISQVVVERKSFQQFEYKRTLRFALLGTCLVGPVIRGWYLAMERFFGSQITLGTTLSKVAADQLGFSPIFTSVIIGTIGLTQGMDFYHIKTKLKNELVDVIFTGWKVWPACQLINFYFMPFLLRPLVVAVVGLLWNVYLAWKTNH